MNRFQIVCAALTEICWPTIARDSVVNASPRRVRWTPAIAADQPAHHGIRAAERAGRVVPVGGLHRPSRTHARRRPRARDGDSAGGGSGTGGQLDLHRRRGGENAGNGTLRGFYFWGWQMHVSRFAAQLARLVVAVGLAAAWHRVRRRPSPRRTRTKSCTSLSRPPKTASTRSAFRIFTRRRCSRASSSAC